MLKSTYRYSFRRLQMHIYAKKLRKSTRNENNLNIKELIIKNQIYYIFSWKTRHADSNCHFDIFQLFSLDSKLKQQELNMYVFA